MNKILGKFLLMLFLTLPNIAYSAVDILVSTDRNPVHMDESFQLVFESNGSVDDDPDFSPIRVLLDVVRQSENSSISIINGSMTRSKKWVLTVMPKAVGDIQIPAIHFGDDKSQPLLIKVKKADQAQMGDSSFFVKIESDLKSSIEQAQIIVTVRVFSDKSLNEISLSSLQFNHGDVVVETLGDEKSFQTKIQGKAYLVVEKKIALFPQKPGPLVVQPVLALGEVRVGARTFFGNPASKSVRARSDSLKIDVKAKPASATTWLPAKSLTIKDEWLSDPSQFTVGEPITRVLTLTATGLTAAQLPELSIKKIDSVKLYPDQDVLKNTVSGSGIVGVRQEKIAYIPSKTGVITLPAKEINWWNTSSGQWEKAQIAEQIITVKPSETFVEQAPVVTQTVDKKVDEKLNLEPSTVQEQGLIKPLNSVNESWWKWLALALGLAWLITLYFYFNKGKSTVIKDDKPIVKPPLFNMSDLKKACSKGDAKACKSELIKWANVRYLGNDFTQLADLKGFVSEQLLIEVEKLETLLYASNADQQSELNSLYQCTVDENKKTIVADEKDNKRLKSLHLTQG